MGRTKINGFDLMGGTCGDRWNGASPGDDYNDEIFLESTLLF
jgi:hypothetical protein